MDSGSINQYKSTYLAFIDVSKAIIALGAVPFERTRYILIRYIGNFYIGDSMCCLKNDVRLGAKIMVVVFVKETLCLH